MEVDSTDGEIVSFHLYEDAGDHTATWDWYYIDRMTGIGTDLLGDEIDLTNPNSHK